MHPKTVELKSRLLDPALPVADKLALLKDAYKGETAYVLACGPSLSEYPSAELEKLLKDKLVLCIKQALDVVPTQGDYLLLNSWNFRNYDFGKGRPVVIRESGAADPPVFLKGDIELSIPKPSHRDEQLAISHAFDEYVFSKRIERPWGPGVLYELGFYLVEHFGCSKAVTLGWDVGVKNSPQMPHFYDTTSAQTVGLIRKARDIEDITEKNKFLHDNFVTYNRPKIIPEEVDDCAAVSGAWATWLNGRNIDLRVVSKNSLAADTIPRTRLENEV
jgi:hypothetical protein